MKPKQEERKSHQEFFEEFRKSLGTLVDQRWWVEEYTPAGNHGYYGDVDFEEKVVQKSTYFKTKEEAETFMESVRPTWPDNELRVKGQNCYERLERYWL